MKQDEPIDPDQLFRNAYKEAYEDPIRLDAAGGVHADSMPRVRAFAGNEDSGPGTFTKPSAVEVTHFKGRENEHVSEVSTEQFIDGVARAMAMATKDQLNGHPKDPERAL